ncbi:hypothetical protein RND81_09G061600 [Saponaria officinalis]|uniref:Uncharacterized protein n=1 Tax=Saponaria officinalis TaxID=3572 RepID=A0AAW1IIL2_SAPOF
MNLLKKTTQIILPCSLFSILFLHPSLSPFLHSILSNLSTFYCQIISLASDKNYIFLLCNGILVFIAKYSCQTLNTRHVPVDDGKLTFQPPVNEKSALVEYIPPIGYYEHENNMILEEKDENERPHQIYYGDVHEIIKEEEKEEERPYENIHEDVHDGLKKGYSIEEYENMCTFDDEEEEVIGKMSTEELNRKFDDFIRKMKEELRFEARQQLITV